MLELVEKTWEDLGNRIDARGYWTWVRTDPHREKIGSIWLPPKLASFHGELPHLVNVIATVLTSGPEGLAAEFSPGDRVFFKRLYFGYWRKMEDGTFVGWIDANQIDGFIDGDTDVGQSIQQAGAGT